MELKEKGITIIKDAMDISLLSSVKMEFQSFWRNLYSEIVKGNFTSVDLKYDWILDKSHYSKVKNMTVTDIQGSSVLHIGPGRFDVDLIDIEGIWNSEEFVQSSSGALKSIIEESLGGKYGDSIKWRIGALPSEAHEEGKNGDGKWHRDTISLFSEAIDITLPPHYITVIVPLDPVKREDGPTEFLLGSHHKKWQEARTSCESVVYELDVGDIVVFDGRICHRGTTNTSSATRTVMYFVFHKDWYNEDVDLKLHHDT
jgi:hypothetical protein